MPLVDSFFGFYFTAFVCSILGHWVVRILAICEAAFLAFVFIENRDFAIVRSDFVRGLIDIYHLLCGVPFRLYSTGGPKGRSRTPACSPPSSLSKRREFWVADIYLLGSR